MSDTIEKMFILLVMIIVVGAMVIIGGKGYYDRQLELESVKQGCDLTMTNHSFTIVCSTDEK